MIYDYENRLTQVKQGATVLATFVYDASGQRVKSTVGTVTTIYIGGVYEYQAGATTQYYEGNAMRRTGYASSNGVYYMLQDHLKSSSVIVAQNIATVSRNYYLPFGGNRGTPTAFNSLTTKRFTGQYHESTLPGGEGLSYYGARWYDAKLGKFLTPDSIVPGPGNPQAFNRYAYVLNRPLVMIDPTAITSMRFKKLDFTNLQTSPLFFGLVNSFMIYLCLALYAQPKIKVPYHFWYIGIVIVAVGALIQLFSTRILWRWFYEAVVTLVEVLLSCGLLWVALTRNGTSQFLTAVSIVLLCAGGLLSILLIKKSPTKELISPQGNFGALDPRTGEVDMSKTLNQQETKIDNDSSVAAKLTRLTPLFAGVGMFLVRVLSEDAVTIMVAFVAFGLLLLGLMGLSASLYYIITVLSWENRFQ